MTTLLEEAKQMLRDMPWVIAALAIAIVFGMGVRASIFYEADGEHVRLIADRNATAQNNHAASRLLSRVERTTMCDEKIPGFTVVVGLSDYSVELSVPVEGMRSVFDDAQMKLADSLNGCKRIVA